MEALVFSLRLEASSAHSHYRGGLCYPESPQARFLSTVAPLNGPFLVGF
jgi:hypothetical protein